MRQANDERKWETVHTCRLCAIEPPCVQEGVRCLGPCAAPRREIFSQVPGEFWAILGLFYVSEKMDLAKKKAEIRRSMETSHT